MEMGMRFVRATVAGVVGLVFAALGAVPAQALPAQPRPAQPQPAGQAVVTLRSGQYVITAVSAASVGASGIPGGSEVFQLRSQANTNLCLDADTNGGGVNGNKVQLYTCLGVTQPNQFWWPRSGNTWTELVNVKYQTKCLDADNSQGIHNGVRVQLWDCFDNSTLHANQWWLFGPGDGATYVILPNLAGNLARLELDAATQTIGDGGKVQLWEYNGGPQQHWRQ
jgi:hypothetical protein